MNKLHCATQYWLPRSLFKFFVKLLDQRCWRFSEGYLNNFSTELSTQIFDCCPRNLLIQEERIDNVVNTSSGQRDTTSAFLQGPDREMVGNYVWVIMCKWGQLENAGPQSNVIKDYKWIRFWYPYGNWGHTYDIHPSGCSCGELWGFYRNYLETTITNIVTSIKRCRTVYHLSLLK